MDVPSGSGYRHCEKGTAVDTISQQAARLDAEWATDARWKDTSRTYSAEQVIRLRGTVQEEYTLARLGAERLRTLLEAEDAVTAAAVDLLRPLDGKDPGTLGAIKQAMFGAAARALTADDAAPQT